MRSIRAISRVQRGAVRPFSAKARVARYEQHGPASSVMKVVEETLPKVKDNQVLLRFLAAPLNPADFNMIEGVYSIRPPLPAIGGNEGVAVVVEAGKAVRNLKPGDWVLPFGAGFGTWRDFAVTDEEAVDKVANDIPAEAAATLSVNPCTAWRMLHDFAKLKPGDVVIQNGANSGVGQAVIELSRHLGFRTVNIIRKRPNLQEVADRLKALGGDYVVSDEFLGTAAMRQMFADEKLPHPALGLNCVGGDSSLEITRLLADGGAMVTYGGMSRKPIAVPTGRMIFNDISLHGFWLTRWVATHDREQRKEMLDKLTDLVRAGKLTTNVEKWKFEDFAGAITRAREGFRDKKVVLMF